MLGPAPDHPTNPDHRATAHRLAHPAGATQVEQPAPTDPRRVLVERRDLSVYDTVFGTGCTAEDEVA